MSTRRGEVLLFFFCILLPTLPVMADGTETFSLTIEEAQQKAEANSHNLQSARLLLEAAQALADSASSSLYPRADLNGKYYYQTHVPTQTSATGAKVEMGDNHNYSVGPVISYTLFDGGQNSQNTRSARLRADAQRQEYLSRRRDIKHALDLTYARAQLSATSLALTMDSLKLAQEQYADIDLRFRVGSASRLDQIAAHKELLSYQLFFYRSQNELAAALRDLLALTGDTAVYNTTRPLPLALAAGLPPGIEPPTILTALEDLEQTLHYFTDRMNALALPGENTPQVKALSLSAQSAQMASRGQKGANWPKLGLSAESKVGYPDASNKEDYTNNIFSISISLPVWDAHLNSSLAEKYLKESRAQEEEKAQILSDLARDHSKSIDAIASLEAQHRLSQEVAGEAAEISRLTYHAYTTGRSTFLEVHNANLQLMEARVNTARIEYELIRQMSDMEYRSSTPEH